MAIAFGIFAVGSGIVTLAAAVDSDKAPRGAALLLLALTLAFLVASVATAAVR